MRITNHMIIQNLLNTSQAISKSDLSPEQKALIGKLIEGQIVKAEGAFLTLNSEGVELSLMNQTNHPLEKGDWITAEIVDFKEGSLVVNIKSETELVSNQKIPNLLSKLNLTVSEDNVKLVDALVKNSIPVTKENVALMKQSMLEVKSLLGEFDKLTPHQKTWVLENMETPVKILVMQLIEQSPNAAPKSEAVPHPIEPVAVNDNAIKDLQIPADIKTENMSKELVAILNDVMSTQMASNAKEPTDAVVKLLQTFDFDKDSSLIKKELVLNIKNMMLIENELNPVKSIGDSFTKVADIVKNMPADRETVIALLAALSEDRSIMDKLDVLTKLLLSENIDDESKSQISKEVLFVKEAVQIAKTTNDTFVMMQIPVMIENENKKVDLYVKTKNKKVDPDEMSLLIALTTNRFEEVRCLINKTGNHYRLDFSFKEEAYKDHFKSMDKELKNAINSLGIQSFDVTYGIVRSDFVMESKSESTDFTTIDIKV